MTGRSVMSVALGIIRDARAVATIVDGRDHIDGAMMMTSACSLVGEVYNGLCDLDEQAGPDGHDCRPSEIAFGLACAAQSICTMAPQLGGITADGCLGLHHIMNVVATELEKLGVMTPVARQVLSIVRG